MSRGKHRLAQPRRVCDIHVRVLGAGLIGRVGSPVVNPIRGRSGTFDSSLIGSRSPFPRNMAHVMLRRLGGHWKPVKITNRNWVSAVAGAAARFPSSGTVVTDVTFDAISTAGVRDACAPWVVRAGKQC